MRMKKTLSFLLSMVMLLSTVLCVNITALADDITFDYESSTGVLTVYGTGEIKNYEEDSLALRPWQAYVDDAKKVVISEGITSIGDYAFSRMRYLEDVVIPSTVTSLGMAAFAGNDSLKEITVPKTVETINDYAFGFDFDMEITDGFVAYCEQGSKAQEYCFKNYVPFDSPIENGTATAHITYGGQLVMWSFVPLSNGTITFSSESKRDTQGLIFDSTDYIYSSEYKTVKNSAKAYNDDVDGNSVNFKVPYKVESGKRYYLAAKLAVSSVEDCDINVKTSFVCTEHNYGEPVISNNIDATCIIKGSYDATYHCIACGDEKTEHIESDFGPHNYQPTVNGYVTTFTCNECTDSYVVSKEALASAVEEANENISSAVYAQKYTQSSRADYESALDEANTALNATIYTQKEIDAYVSALETAFNSLELNSFTVDVQVVNSETGDSVYPSSNNKVEYGSEFTYDYVIDKFTEGEYAGLPMYTAYKWVENVKGNDSIISNGITSLYSVVTADVSYTLYLIPFDGTKADDTTQTRVRYLDKANRTIEVQYTTKGEPVTANATAPTVPFYEFACWEQVFGNTDAAGNQEIVFKATYEFAGTEANMCNIIAVGGIKVNDKASDKVGYDKLVTLSGANSYAYCDKDGNILSAINGTTIYAPHTATVYVTKVETVLPASTLVTGNFITNNGEYKTLTVNAQYYVPSGVTADECGIEVKKTGDWTKVKSTTQGANHEYSIAMNYSVACKLYVRPYVIVDDVVTYGDVVEITLE